MCDTGMGVIQVWSFVDKNREKKRNNHKLSGKK